MKTNETIKMVIICAGVAGAAALSIYAIHKCNITRKEVGTLLKELEDISSGVECSVPDELMVYAMEKAAEREASKMARVLADESRAVLKSEAKDAVKNESEVIKKHVRSELEKQLTKVDISEMKRAVTNEAAKKIVNEVSSGFGFSSGNDIPSIVKACKDAGMSSWQIENILEKYKG